MPPSVVRAGSPRENGLWAVGQQISTLALTGIFSIVLVRFVSVADFGLFSYAITVASLGVAVMASGLQGLAIREFRNRSESSSAILGALFLLREVMALAVYVVFAMYTVLASDASVITPTLIACLAVLARVLDAPELWFQARLQTRSPALIRICTAGAFFVVRVAVLLWNPDVTVLILLFVAEQLVNGILISLQYRRQTGVSPFTKADLAETRFLARRALPLALSGIANQINLRADILIVQALLGNVNVGLYSAAARLSEILYVLPTAYMTATFPNLLDVRRDSGPHSAEYKRHLQRGFDMAFWFGVFIVTGTLVTAGFVVEVLFGRAYIDSVAVLQVHVLACPFVFMAAILSKWIVAEDLLWISLVRHGIGALLSVGLNLVLIPTYGIVGSAWATVAAYASASYLFCFFGRSTFGVAVMMTKAPFAPIRFVAARLTYKGTNR
jgi:O-antigen/teichoic acid export membrane protein